MKKALLVSILFLVLLTPVFAEEFDYNIKVNFNDGASGTNKFAFYNGIYSPRWTNHVPPDFASGRYTSYGGLINVDAWPLNTIQEEAFTTFVYNDNPTTRTFRVSSDDGMRYEINDVTLFSQITTYSQRTVNFPAGWSKLTIYYNDITGNRYLVFYNYFSWIILSHKDIVKLIDANGGHPHNEEVTKQFNFENQIQEVDQVRISRPATITLSGYNSDFVKLYIESPTGENLGQTTTATRGVYKIKGALLNDDFSQLLCNNKGFDWLPNAPADNPDLKNYCCGDDGVDDGGQIFQGPLAKYLCVNNSDGGNTIWQWKRDDETPGNIYHITKGDYSVLSNGTDWIACDASGSIGIFDNAVGTVISSGQEIFARPVEGLGHYYLCFNKTGVGQFSECSGDGSNVWNEKYPLFGEKHTTGQVVRSTKNSYQTTIEPNQASEKSCNQICQEEGKECVSVGTDGDASNNKYSRSLNAEEKICPLPTTPTDPNLGIGITCSFPACKDDDANCDTIMYPDPLGTTCIDTYKTNCQCEKEVIGLSDPYGPSYYCTATFDWVTQLHDSDENTCDFANFTWTGSKCCGSNTGDFFKDSYSDEGWWIDSLNERNPKADGVLIGGCFKNKKIDNNTLVSDYNLIKNSGFDEGLDKLDYWTNQGATVEGNNNLLTLGTGESASQDITNLIVPGQTYELSAIVASAEGGSPSVVVLNNAQQIASLSNTESTIFVPVSGSTAIRASCSGSCFFDNITVNFFNKSLLNYNGSFFSCNLNNPAIFIGSDSNPLLQENHESCQVLGDYFCAPDTRWQLSTNGAKPSVVRNNPKSTPENYAPVSASCCNASQCWNGTWCVDSEVGQPVSPLKLDDKNWQCINGGWELSVERSTWDNSKRGFCKSVTECLVDPTDLANPENNYLPETYTGQINNPQCINNTQFIGDHYCDDGKWTSRTKFLALQLLNFTAKINPDSFSLYCDNYKNSLVDYKYGDVEDNFLKGTFAVSVSDPEPRQFHTCDSETPFECINNFCILKIQQGGVEKRAFAVSLNKPINSDRSFLNTLDKQIDYCDNVNDGNWFEKCSQDDHIWYTKDLNSMIFTDNSNFVDFEAPSIFRTVINFFSNLFSEQVPTNINKLDSLLDEIAGSEIVGYKIAHNFTYANLTHDYNRIYFAKSGNKLVQGVIEEPNSFEDPILVVIYENVGEGLCSSLSNFLIVNEGQGDSNCTDLGSEEYYFISTESTVHSKWPDLTSKLRVS